MSVFEPHIDQEPDGAGQLPPLDVPLRGRKGEQITAYIQDLASRIDQQRGRAELAERAAAHLNREVEALRNRPPPSFEHLGSEAAKVLEEAGRSAKVLVEEAKERGKDLVKEAERAAEQVRGRAEHDAVTRLDAARQAAEQMLAKANGERSVTEAETKRLRQYRDSLLGHLGRVQTDLAGFIAGASDAAHAPPIPPPAQGQQAAAVSPSRPAGAEVTPQSAQAAAELPPPPPAGPSPSAEPAQDAPAATPKPAESAIASARAPK